jgi:hypothetical protein
MIKGADSISSYKTLRTSGNIKGLGDNMEYISITKKRSGKQIYIDKKFLDLAGVMQGDYIEIKFRKIDPRE